MDANSKTTRERKMQMGKMWAYYLVYPCIYFHAVATRLPLVFSALYAINGLNLKPHWGVLAVAIFSLGRAFGATVLSQKDAKAGVIFVATGSSVLSFTAMMLIPTFPNTNCDRRGYDCFKVFEDDQNFDSYARLVCHAVHCGLQQLCNRSIVTVSPRS